MWRPVDGFAQASNPNYIVSMRRVLATDFGIWPMLQNLGHASDTMVNSPEYWARLANYILLYDQIIIPTGNLQVLPVLRLMLGEGAFNELIRSKGIVLARFDQWFGYAGNGIGLTFFKVFDGPNRAPNVPNLATSYFKPLEEAIRDAIAITRPSSSSERKVELTSLLLDNVINLPTEAVADGLKEEVYRDILGSPYLRDFLFVQNAGRSLDHLVGIGPDQLTIFNPHVPMDHQTSADIRAVLRVAFENFLLSIGGHTDVSEITGDDATLTLLRAKGQRLGFPHAGENAFAKIQKIGGVPDLGAAYAAKQLSPEQLLDLCYSKHAQALRDWFSKGTPGESAEETLRRYTESVGKATWLESLPAKLLRFAATTGIGAAQPWAGAVTSLADAFLLTKWFPRRSPRLFMEHAKVVISNSPVVASPEMRGRDRNQLCSCGSGKKLKHCCGR